MTRRLPLATVLTLGLVAPAHAFIYTVNSGRDLVDANPGDGFCRTGEMVGIPPDTAHECTLRAAIMEANTDEQADEIRVPAGTYLVGLLDPDDQGEDAGVSGDYDVSTEIAIEGAGIEDTFVYGVFPVKAEPAKRAFHVLPGGLLTVRDMTVGLQFFETNLPGGCFLVDRAGLVLEDTRVEGCVSSDRGGAIASILSGVSVIRSNIHHNNTKSLDGGGGLHANGGSVAIVDSTFTINGGEPGSAMRATAPTRVRIERSGFWQFNDTDAHSMIYTESQDFEALNATIGGSLHFGPGARGNLVHATLADVVSPASRPVLITESPGWPRIVNSILGSEADPAGVAACTGAPTSLGYNMIRDDSCFAAPAAGDLPSTDPRIGPISGTTYAIGNVSPAVDRIPPDHFCPQVDQNGAVRPGYALAERPLGCDIGAVELSRTFDNHIYLVNSFDDRIDSRPGDGNCWTGMSVGSPPESECTLRAAVMEANASYPDDHKTIRLDAGTYRLAIPDQGFDDDDAATGDLDVSTNLSVIGVGTGGTVVDTVVAGASVAADSYGRIFDVAGGMAPTPISLVLADLTLADGGYGPAPGEGRGGAVRVRAGGRAVASRVLFTSNVARGGGAVHADGGAFRATACEFSGNGAVQEGVGGAIELVNGATATVTDSIVTGNGASNGSAIHVDAASSASVTNSTFSRNHPGSSPGAGIHNRGTLDLTHVTISERFVVAGQDFAIINEGTLTARASILWRSGAQTCSGGPLQSGGYNVAHASCGLADATDFVGDPMLGLLADNGGGSRTVAIGLTSPAAEIVPEAECIPTDQRGVLRPQDADADGDPRCDAGAYELRLTNNDLDGDGHANESDNCFDVANADQADADADGFGDVCDCDLDGDGYPRAGCSTVQPSDCDDTNAEIRPGSSEDSTNGIDDDCDGLVDETEIEINCMSATLAVSASAETEDVLRALAPLGAVAALLAWSRKRARRRGAGRRGERS